MASIWYNACTSCVVVVVMLMVGDDNDGNILTVNYSHTFQWSNTAWESGSFSSGLCDALLRKIGFK